MAMSAFSPFAVLDSRVANCGCCAARLAFPRPPITLAKERVRINSRRVGRPALGGDGSDYHSSLLSGFILDPGNLGIELLERGTRNVRAGGHLGRHVSGKGGQRGTPGQKGSEVARAT